MSISKGGGLVLLALLVGVLAGLAALVQPANAGSTAPAANGSTVVGTVSTRMVLNRFTAVGRRVVGRGTVVSTFRNSAGKTTVKRKHFWIRIHGQAPRLQEDTMCHILFLEIGEVDLVLAGLHAVLRSATTGEPVQLRLQGRREGGILGRLFCDLSQAGGTLATREKAVSAAKTLNKRVRKALLMHVRAVMYGPNRGTSISTSHAALLQQQQEECAVLHLVLGPVHLDLLGLVVDLNKIVLDLTAIPGTLLGNIFCQLTTPPPPPPAPATLPTD